MNGSTPILMLLCGLLPAISPLESLHVYNGTWIVTPATPPSGNPAATGPAKPDTLINTCHETSAFYTCEQMVNGKAAALVIFTATDDPHTFHSQVVLPNGRAVGRSDITIDGPHWTYNSTGTDDAGKPISYRTENYFTGPDKIHFEQYESTDQKKTWVMKGQGDEVRVPR